MFENMTPEGFSALAAMLAALATGFAAYTAWRGPMAAAKLAEELRQSADRDNEKRRLKLHVFATLMQERANLATTQGAQALNLIDLVFNDSRAVREAWAELYLSFDGSRGIPPHEREARTRTLLSTMATNLGLSDGLRTDDFGRIYYPNCLAEEEHVRTLERQAAIKRLTSSSAPESNSISDKWPPKPA